jgi:Yip1 domain
MAVDSPTNANGLRIVWDTIVAPKAAFESIRNVPTWGWALLIAIVLFALGTYIEIPANAHAVSTDWPNMVAKSPILSGLSSAEQQSQLQTVVKVMSYTWIAVVIAVPFFSLITAVLYLIFDKVGHGDGTFGKYWAAACNISVVAGIGILLTGIITIIRGPDSFLKPVDVPQAMPSLGLLAPQAGPKLAIVLTSITPFTLWALWLGVTALSTVGRVPRVTAWLGGIAAFLIPVLFGVAFAR